MIFDRPIDQFVPGPQGMAGRVGPCGVLLSVDAAVSSRRTVRTNVTSQAGGGIDTSQHCGGARAGQYRQLRTASPYFARFAEGAGDPPDLGGAGRHFACARFADHSDAVRELGEDGSRFDTIAAGQASKMTFAIRYSPFAIRSQAELASCTSKIFVTLRSISDRSIRRRMVCCV